MDGLPIHTQRTEMQKTSTTSPKSEQKAKYTLTMICTLLEEILSMDSHIFRFSSLLIHIFRESKISYLQSL